MQRNTILWTASGVAAGALLTSWQLRRWFSEEPEYDVEQSAGSIEIRRYQRCVRAETTLEAESWQQALELGFRRLARYIFGANHRRQLAAQGQLEERPEPLRKQGEKIQMTAPVTARAVPRDAVSTTAGALQRYTVAFTLPKARAAGSLPVPEDRRVHLRAVPARHVAVLRYRGDHGFELMREKSAYLREVLQRAGLSTRGEPEFAGYDAPSTLPWLRRNEIWIELGSAPQQRSLEAASHASANNSAFAATEA
ncbi:MAG: heme-binding protein [Polyangiaceae bacterium]